MRRCIRTYADRCGPDPQDATKTRCEQLPAAAARNVSETECQVCRHVWHTEMVDTFKW